MNNTNFRGFCQFVLIIIIPGGSVQEYKEVNAKESVELADAFLSYNFLNVTENFLNNSASRYFFRLNTNF